MEIGLSLATQQNSTQNTATTVYRI